MDIDQIKLKTVDELLPNEQQFLIENRDKLNEEDLAAYASILPQDEGQGDSGAGDQGTQGDGTGEQGTGDTGDNGESKTSYTFQSEEEARAFVEKQIEDREATRKAAEDEASKQAAIDAAGTAAEKKWVEENWKPKDWNEGIQTAAEAAVKLIDERTQAQNAKQKANSDRLEQEWQTVSKEHKLPDRNTDEGKKIHDQIVTIALKHGKTDFPSAYELWSQIPQNLGGGYQIEASDAGAALAKAKMNAQKNAAGQVGNGTGGAEKGKGAKWGNEDIRTKSLDQLLDERMRM